MTYRVGGSPSTDAVNYRVRQLGQPAPQLHATASCWEKTEEMKSRVSVY